MINFRFEKQLILFGYLLLSAVIFLNLIFLFMAPSLGDEGFYIHEIRKVHEMGVYQAMATGFSYLFVLLTIGLNTIINNEYISMRLISLVSSIGIFFVSRSLFNQLKIDKRYQHLYLLTIAYILTKSQEFFLGLPDRTMVLFILLGIKYFFKYYYNRGKLTNLFVSSFFLGASLWLREFSFIFLLAFTIIFVILSALQKRKGMWLFIRNGILWGGIITVVAILPQIPSLLENNTIVFEDKNTPFISKDTIIEKNWDVRNWFTHIERIDRNSIFVYGRVPWEKLETLIEQSGGINNIPITVNERFKADPKFFIDQILSNLFRLLFLVVFGLGLVGILSLDYFRKPEQIFATHLQYRQDFLIGIIIIILTTSIVLSIKIIGYIEWRWFTLPLLMCGLLGVFRLQLIESNSFKRKLTFGQFVFLLVMYGYIINHLIETFPT